MRFKILGIACVVVAAGLWAYAHGQAGAQPTPSHEWIALPAEAYTLPPGQDGRYQIITASIDSVYTHRTENGESIPIRTILRIDTQTGRTWRMEELQGTSGYPTQSWVPINESRLKEN
jgi:hypothetical protein